LIEKYIVNGEQTVLYIPHKEGIMEAIIDTEDLQRVLDFPYYWCVSYDKHHPTGYVGAPIYYPSLGRTGKTIRLHRFVLNYEGKQKVDHINNNGLDNRKSNLRLVSHQHNTTNRKSKNSNNKSGYRNVFWNKQSSKWTVDLQVDGKHKRFGLYTDVNEAGRVAEEMRQKYFGEFAGKS